MQDKCPCGASNTYSLCCGRIHQDIKQADTAETLMRSRYSAFVMANEAYLLESWHPETRPEHVNFDKACKWLGLKVVQTQGGQHTDGKGQVAFVARYKVAGKAHRIVENSLFIKLNDCWYYHSALDE